MAEQTTRDRGKLIVLEGLDGSGKSTQIELLEQGLRRLGRRVLRTAEPTGSDAGALIRDALRGERTYTAAELAGLFLTDRICHNVDPESGIAKALAEGTDVICDRYYYSSFAYQSIGADLGWIMDMNLNCPQIARPDLCIFLDIDALSCKQRLDATREHLEIFERDAELMGDIRARFLEAFRLLRGRENIRILDAARPAGQVAEDIFRLVTALSPRPD